jgi:hypothetical protein
MPTSVAEVHNLFWTGFAQVGVAKILDSLRHLYVKDAQGCVNPFKIFIKFQFSSKFGYCFVGLFRKPYNVLFDEQQTVKLKHTYSMICNEKGKVLEISPSMSKLLRLKPREVDQLHSILPENFNICLFNRRELNFQRLNFNGQPSLFFKHIELDFVELKRLTSTLEII